MSEAQEVFCCPVCGGPLKGRRTGRGGCAPRPEALACPKGHSFDMAREGYVNLMEAGRRHAKVPGDSPAMVAARRAFLDEGHYEPFAAALGRICLELAGSRPGAGRQGAPVFLDAGCGEGYYTMAAAGAFAGQGRAVRLAGYDISKAAVRAAARRDRAGCVQWAVAGSFRIPVADGTVDVVTNLFSPMAPAEFARVLAPGGMLVYAVPGPRHLWQLKQVLYDTPYENPVRDVAYPGFRFVRRIPVQASLSVKGAAVGWLFAMTPYFWKTPRSGAERLAELDRLETQAQFDFCIYEKEL